MCGGLLVENGQRLNASDKFVNQQWIWFNIAAVVTSLAGGALIEILLSLTALHVAAWTRGRGASRGHRVVAPRA